jgi:hypothetical protein
MTISILIIVSIIIIFYRLYSKLELDYCEKFSKVKSLEHEKMVLQREINSLKDYIKYIETYHR